MALRKLTEWDNQIFRKTSRAVEKFDERLWTLLEDMKDMLKSVGGYGCAAVHIGVLRRVIVVNGENGMIEMINPTITEMSKVTQNVREGSVAPGAPSGMVSRPKNVTVSVFDRNGNPIAVCAGGFLAATFCHELDHFDGILFTDKINRI